MRIQNETEDPDVIVIGAGIAGLAAARALSRRGRRVMILEARNRIGGRIWTDTIRGWPDSIELGAEFIHGGNRALGALMREVGAGKRPLPKHHWFFHRDRLESLPDAWDRIDAAFRHIGPTCKSSFSAWFRRNGHSFPGTDRLLVQAFVKGFNGAPPERMSAHTLYAAAKEGAGEQSRPDFGYERLVKALAAQLPPKRVSLRLRTAVTSVRWTRNQVIVSAGNRQWRARAAIITVPLGVLKARPGRTGAIRFIPPLVARQRLLRRLETGHAMRIVLRLRESAWRKGPIPPELRSDRGRRFGFLQSIEKDFPVWWSNAPAPILVGWTGGPSAARLAKLSKTQIFRRALRTLAKLFRSDERLLARLVLDWRVHDWTSDPFTRGAYSFSIAGEEDSPTRLGKPVAGILFFAGEATADPLELGTVHGALASGSRAAGEFLGKKI